MTLHCQDGLVITMRLAIDARMMGAEATRGIGRYIHELVAALLKVAPQNKYILIAKSSDHAFRSHPSVETIVADIPWYGWQEQIEMPGVFKSAKADVVFVPHWNAPLFYNGPLFITIHDLLLRHFPQSAKVSTRNPFTRLIKRLGYRLILTSTLKKARRIFVPTEFVAQDVASFYPSVTSKIKVTGEGMPELKYRVPGTECLVFNRSTQYAVRDTASPNFLLYIGAAYPHKGLQDLLRAWKTISKKHPNLLLKIAGEMDVFMKTHEKWTKEHSLERVEFLDRVSENELDTLYTQAKALIFPSHFEGFGLPPLEAMAHGCPVIASRLQVLIEVLGQESAIFFEAGSSDGIISAVEQLLVEPEKYGQLTAKAAQELAQRHDWFKTAERLINFISWEEGK